MLDVHFSARVVLIPLRAYVVVASSATAPNEQANSMATVRLLMYFMSNGFVYLIVIFFTVSVLSSKTQPTRYTPLENDVVDREACLVAVESLGLATSCPLAATMRTLLKGLIETMLSVPSVAVSEKGPCCNDSMPVELEAVNLTLTVHPIASSNWIAAAP